MPDRLPVVVLSHLRWNFVYQRPQHVLSRLAASRPVLFVEEPVHDPRARPHAELARPQPNVLVCRPHTPVSAPGFVDAHLPVLHGIIDELVRSEHIDDFVLWTYTPMPMPLVRKLGPLAIVYDCMDELSAFLGSPPELVPRERELFRVADLVFTGGPSLYRAKRDLHPAVHCFPSSVDVAHFARARDGLREAADQAPLPRPRLGFYGVIDERLDLRLLDALATSHPEWQIVMIGPTVKIDPAVLPRRPNITYFGQRSYDDLPAYLAGWDVCLLPFALNDATRFISPTKTLEYMAAEHPIVATPITDVAEPYRTLVYLGETPREFVAACEHALDAGEAERRARAGGMRRTLAGTSWDATVAAMDRLIEAAVEKRRSRAA